VFFPARTFLVEMREAVTSVSAHRSELRLETELLDEVDAIG
jgi:hypothetical protein